MAWEFSSQAAEDSATPSEDTASSATVSGTPPNSLPTALPLAEHEPTAPQVLPTVVKAGDAAVLVVELVVVVVIRDAATLTFVVHAPATRATRSMSANDVVLLTARVFHGLTPLSQYAGVGDRSK
jgi:cytoskeletal protein RodZ